MKNIARALGTALVVGGALLTAAPGASAATATTAASASTLEPPTVTSATLVHDSVSGDYVRLLWNPSPSAGVAQEAVYANGKFLFESAPSNTNPTCGNLASIFLKQRGLTGHETFTLTARDSQGHESAPSNGLVAVSPKELPAPTLTSAVIKDDKLTMTWTPSHTDEVSGKIIYELNADNGAGPGAFENVVNATTATTDTTITNPNDPTTIPLHITKDTKLSVLAQDCTTATSPLSNVLQPTDG